MRKLFTFFLALAASVGTMLAESGTCGDNLTWELTDGVLTISGTGLMTNYSSSSTAPWFSYSYSITSAIINEGVTNIGQYAFYRCYYLTSVSIPNSVTSIGERAFYECSNLTAVIIPNSVTSIEDCAFHSCSSLTSVTIPEGVTRIEEYTFYRCSNLTSVTIPNSVISIGNDAFSLCANLTSVIIPNSVASIENSAFYGCAGLTSFEIPNSVISIGDNAFSNVPYIIYNGTATGSPWGARSVNGYVDGWLVYSDNTKTTLLACLPDVSGEVIIPNSVTCIGNNAFYRCKNLTSVNIPNKITSIGEKVFCDCSSLISITIPNSVTSIGSYAFSGCSGLTSFEIPNSVTSIGEHAFYFCTGLTSVTIPNSVTSIGDFAFGYCHNATSIDIPNSVTSIGEFAFCQCINLISTVIPTGVNEIKEYTFYACSSLLSATIGENVVKIGNEAFGGCWRLEQLYFLPTTPPSISHITFNQAGNFVAYVPFGCVAAYKSAPYYYKNIEHMPIYTEISNLSSTSCTAIFNAEYTDLISVSIEDGESFDGNTLELSGLEPNKEYNDISVVLTSNTGKTETLNVSFTTTALELTTQPSKPVSSNTAILLAETNMADIETSCGFEWRRENQPENMPSTQVICPVANGTMAGRLKGLKDDIYYKYRAFYQSAAGNMYYGDWQYIFTGDVTVEFEPILYTYAASAIKENEATLKGYALAGSTDFTEQGFEYWPESRVMIVNDAPRRISSELGEHHTVTASGISMKTTLTNLDAGTVYRYRTYAKIGNQVLYGSEMTFTTQGEYEPEEAIDNVQSDQVQSTKVLRNGQIYILRGDKVYTVTGQKVK